MILPKFAVETKPVVARRPKDRGDGETVAVAASSGPRYDYVILAWYVILHGVTLAGLWYFPFNRVAAVVFLGSYALRMFGVSAGYHRYFSHRSFKTSRVAQFLLAFLAMSSAQRGVLWWASWHRQHHRCADREGDTHSPIANSFLWSYAGWLISPRHSRTNLSAVKDFSAFPELWWLDRHYYVPPAIWGLALLVLGGPAWAFWGFFASTTLLFHAMAIGNTFGHLWGPRPYDTSDNSHDNWIYWFLTLGEYHNSHHYCMTAANQGLVWWKPDPVYWGITLLGKLGIVWDIRPPTRT
ncbi:MAG TPA: acyl-CoA desaturase [Pirellulaceae bacterium]